MLESKIDIHSETTPIFFKKINIINDEEKNQCNICFGEYNYIKNTLCDCVYYYHVDCFMTWVKHSSYSKCIMCSKPIVVNPIINNKKLIFKNINFNPFIDKPLQQIIPYHVYKYNKSINKKRIENYIFNIEINLLNLTPFQLMVFINNNVNIPPKIKFNYSWKVNINNTIYIITLKQVLDFGIIYTIKNVVNNNIKSNYIDSYQDISQENMNEYLNNNHRNNENNNENNTTYSNIEQINTNSHTSFIQTNNDNNICNLLKRIFSLILICLFLSIFTMIFFKMYS